MQIREIYRILDANLNRAREGWRVADELARLVLEQADLHKALQALRHGLTRAERSLPAALLACRDVAADPGARGMTAAEASRRTLPEVARANLRRTEEALRVLEELAKLAAPSTSGLFKKLRFQTYTVEAALVLRLEKQPAAKSAVRKKS